MSEVLLKDSLHRKLVEKERESFVIELLYILFA